MRLRNFLTGLAALPAAAMAGAGRDAPPNGHKSGRKFTDEEVDELVEQAMGGIDRRRQRQTFRCKASYGRP